MADKKTNAVVEYERLKLAFWLGIIGLGLSVAVMVILIFMANMRASSDIVAVVGLFTSVTGTLVGAFFGMQIGSAGREQERQDRSDAEDMTRLAMMGMDPNSPTKGPILKKMGIDNQEVDS